MSWINFISKLKRDEFYSYYYQSDCDAVILVLPVEAQGAIDDFCKSRSRQDLTLAFSYVALLSDILGLRLANINRNIFADANYKFVAVDRLKDEAKQIQRYIYQQHKAQESLNKIKLSAMTTRLSEALIDAAYACDWKPQELMS